MIVKAGDKHPISWKANMDLTGSLVRLIVDSAEGAPVELATTITDAAHGEVTHNLTGTLPIGRYRVELEVTTGGEIVTFPNDQYARLDVIPDLD